MLTNAGTDAGKDGGAAPERESIEYRWHAPSSSSDLSGIVRQLPGITARPHLSKDREFDGAMLCRSYYMCFPYVQAERFFLQHMFSHLTKVTKLATVHICTDSYTLSIIVIFHEGRYEKNRFCRRDRDSGGHRCLG